MHKSRIAKELNLISPLFLCVMSNYPPLKERQKSRLAMNGMTHHSFRKLGCLSSHSKCQTREAEFGVWSVVLHLKLIFNRKEKV